MAGFLDSFRKKVISSVWKDAPGEGEARDIDDKIALGVLLRVVAEADNKFLPEEHEKIKDVLISYARVREEDLPAVMASVDEAAEERIDLYSFTSEISAGLPYKIRISIVENLFRVACADRELDEKELDTIRKISGLFHISQSDFADAKIKVKKEFQLNTASF